MRCVVAAPYLLAIVDDKRGSLLISEGAPISIAGYGTSVPWACYFCGSASATRA
jgi:hypothetical protein